MERHACVNAHTRQVNRSNIASFLDITSTATPADPAPAETLPNTAITPSALLLQRHTAALMSHFIRIYNHQLLTKHTHDESRNPARQCGITRGKHAACGGGSRKTCPIQKDISFLFSAVVVVFLPVEQLVVQDGGRFVRGAVDAPHCCCRC